MEEKEYGEYECLECGTLIDRENSFCSQQCYDLNND